MPLTLNLAWTLTDEEALLLDRLLLSEKPVGAPPDWVPEPREEFVTRVGLKTLREQMNHFRQEYWQTNINKVLERYGTFGPLQQLDALDHFGLELVGLAVQPKMVSVPDVTGMTQANAVAALSNAKFNVVTVTSNHDTVPDGSVISQTPAPGTMYQARNTVTLTVSIGPALTGSTSINLNTSGTTLD